MLTNKKFVSYAAVLMICIMPCCCNGQEIEFVFNPPDSLEFIQSSRHTKISLIGDSESKSEVMDSKISISLVKTSDGYRMTFTPITYEMTRNGKLVEGSILQVFEKLIVTYYLTENGKIDSITGFENINAMFEEEYPKDVADQLSSMFKEDDLIRKERLDWNARIYDFVGNKIRIGAYSIENEEVPLMTGKEAVFFIGTRFSDIVECGKDSCLKIEYIYKTDPADFNDFFGSDFELLYGEWKKDEEDFKPSDIKVSGNGERLIVPGTMLIKSESSSQTIEMTLDIPGRGLTAITQVQNIEYNYTY